MALLFGSTWFVNALVFASVLGLVLIANAIQVASAGGTRARCSCCCFGCAGDRFGAGRRELVALVRCRSICSRRVCLFVRFGSQPGSAARFATVRGQPAHRREPYSCSGRRRARECRARDWLRALLLARWRTVHGSLAPMPSTRDDARAFGAHGCGEKRYT